MGGNSVSLTLWIDRIRAVRNGRKDAEAELPAGPEPTPYWEYLARKGHRRAVRVERRFWEEDRRNKLRWIQATMQQHQAGLELKRLQHRADQAQAAYEQERALDQAETAELNPPGRAYIPVLVYWVLLALLIAGDAAISYAAFLSLGKILFWQVASLAIMLVVSMVVIGHVIGDMFRHGNVSGRQKVLISLVVIAISVVLTLFRENAQQAVQNASTFQLDTITLNAPGSPSSPAAQPAAPPTTAAPSWHFSLDINQVAGFFMFLIITAMGIAIPGLLAYYVERRPRLLKVAQARQRAGWARFRLGLARQRFYWANRRVAWSKAHRVSRHIDTAAALNENRENTYYLMAVYADATMRQRKSTALPEAMRTRPPVPGAEILGELEWTYPEAQL